MPIHKEEDYFIPVLAPYVQWVKAYRQLISSLYDEHKTVKRAWKAFTAAIPGVERRLKFPVFEQILLFSLFLSEWNITEEGAGSAEAVEQARRGRTDYRGNSSDERLDAVLQKLQEVTEQRDKALWNLKHHEEDYQVLGDRKANLDRQVTIFEKNLEMLQNDLDAANEHLGQLVHKLDNCMTENADLREKNADLREKEASFGQQIEGLRETLSELALDKVQTQPMVAAENPNAKNEFAHAVIPPQGAGQEFIRDSAQTDFPKKVGKWNMQRSKDGYYRLYRKIGGRVHSIYIGKEFDVGKAEKRIAERERELLVTNPAKGGHEVPRGESQLKIEIPPRVVEPQGDDRE